MRNNPRRRRGVLLLVVLGMLSMFAMIGLTFVVLTGQARRIADMGQSVEVQYYPPQSDLDRAMAQVARGSMSPTSAIGPHSLLEDMYGYDPNYGNTRTGYLRSVNDVLTVPNASGTTGGVILELLTTIPYAERYSGSVLTMLNGPAAGVSARIIGYLTGGGRGGRFQVLSTEGMDYATLTTWLRSGFGAIQYVVNGMPFSGKGFGAYNVSTGQLSDVALQPGSHRFGLWPNGGTGNSAGEANEDYDAPDHQNMLLAMVKGPIFPQTTTNTDDTIRVPIPSLHRPDLVNYWVNVKRQRDETSAMRYILRPLRRAPDSPDNPDSAGTVNRAFTGSNPGVFNPLWDGRANNSNYQWDVDNDGDGVPDSIWVDLGMQVRSTADGRLYKPLFAILCTDLDGRINLNAHGCPAQLNTLYYGVTETRRTWEANQNLRNATPAAFASGVLPTNLLFPQGLNYTGAASLALSRGLGCGPAEINPRALFDSASPALATIPQELGWLFRGRNSGVFGPLEGRYGEGVGLATALPGLAYFGVGTGNWNIGYTALNDRDYAYNKNYYGLPFDSYSSPPDLDGDCALALDVAGHPVYWGMGESQPGTATANPGQTNYYSGNLTRNTPYELNLTRYGAWRNDLAQARTVDNPFTLAELERVLRAGDIDSASLPPRLLALTADTTGNLASSQLLKRAADITTASFDLPCPAVTIPPEMRQQYGDVGPAYHLMYLLYRKTGMTGAAAVAVARNLFAPEWLNGLRMNLNRPFGNGRDDNGNGVVDEGGESELLSYPNAPRVACDPSNGGLGRITGLNAGMQARLFYARNLYCLALLLLNPEGTLDADRSVRSLLARKQLAQWAVNVVDFYDRDSIMTRFPYVLNPFGAEWRSQNGWPTNPNDTAFEDPQRGGVVWGVERPELLITETLAIHDRRTTDTAEDEPNKKTVADGDNDFDQKFRPQGSLFIELYNPWSRDDVPSGDVHLTKPNLVHPATAAVNLAQETPTTPAWPVWQVLISAPNVDPEDLDNYGDGSTVHAERVIYFTDPGSDYSRRSAAGAEVCYYPFKKTTDIWRTNWRGVAPGEYVVIGPGDKEEGVSIPTATTYLGWEVGKDDGSKSTRQILLNLDASGKSPGVNVLGNNHETPNIEKVVRPPIPFIINRSYPENLHLKDPQRLSISEPIGGYPEDATASSLSQGRYVYAPVLTTPLDVVRPDDKTMAQAIRNNGLIGGDRRPLRRIHLRRLANPLKAWFDDPKRPSEQNKYITIDSMPVDLTAFNGAAPFHEKELGDDTKKPEVTDSRERGEYARNITKIDVYDLWSQEPYDSLNEKSNQPTPAPPQDHNYDRPFTHTLGYLNSTFARDLAEPPAPAVRSTVHLGDPPRPFPWFNFNNRPFFSSYELTFVPWNSQADLLNPLKFGQSPSGQNFYNSNSNTNVNTWPYRHLRNYFQSQPFPNNAQIKFPPFYRILEMVEVPSRFAGTQIELNPSTMANTGTLEHYFRPPFNWVSAYRDPGKMNINTIYNYDVFRALMNYCGAVVNSPSVPQNDMLQLWDRLVRSRRGDTINVTNQQYTPTNSFLNTVMARMLQMPSVSTGRAMPSRWGNPFRSYAGGHLRTSDQQWVLNSKGMDAEVHATLLRGDPDSPARPLFEYRSQQPHDEAARNPFFRYRYLERLQNLTTTRSNVYAVWITVGYFEVRRAQSTSAQYFPDGYELGQELGIDSGDVQRHRGFYIFDRSIPVGFLRGQDLNFEKALVLRRYIE